MWYGWSMHDEARHVVEEALKLPVAERAEVIAALIASIEGEADEDAEAAWAAEIERRADRALCGESKGTDWATARAEIESRRAPK